MRLASSARLISVCALLLTACASGAANDGGGSGSSVGGAAGSGVGGTLGQGLGGATGGVSAGGASGGVNSAGSAVGGTLGGGAQGGAGASAGAAGSAGAGGAGSDVIQALREYLAIERDLRAPIADQSFALVALSAAEAEEARVLLWDDYAALIVATRQAESEAEAITIDTFTLRYDFTVFGDEPATGRSLFLSLHGGGEAAPSVNDGQWENQKVLHEPAEGIYLAPRAPTDTWNLWHQDHIDGLFDRLITNLIVLENVDPNRVYVMGYSAGGDGVYQLGPRMADYFGAAAMMAGHPNDAKPESLRNIGFTIHVGGLDKAFDRNLVAAEWGGLLDALQAADPGGYAHYVEVHPDKPHWMDLEDAVAVPWIADFTRNPVPDQVVWLQDDITHERFYWLAVNPEDAAGGARIDASYSGQELSLTASGVSHVKLRLSDSMLDLDQPLSVVSGSASLFQGTAERTILTLHTTTHERGDPALVFSAEIEVDL